MGLQSSNVTTAEYTWNDLPDEEVVLYAQNGDLDAEAYLLLKYEKMVLIWTRSYFLQGAEPDDVLQEGMIGLYKAIRDFSNGTSSFWAFAKLCIIRNVISAIKGTTRQKHLPLNSYTSLYKPINDFEGDRTLLETLTNHEVDNPETLVINRQKLHDTSATIKNILSEFEYSVFQFYIAGYTYREIADQLQTHTKSIDNALCRIKLKIDNKLS